MSRLAALLPRRARRFRGQGRKRLVRRASLSEGARPARPIVIDQGRGGVDGVVFLRAVSAAVPPRRAGQDRSLANILRSLHVSALAFFLFSYHVHEKGILVPLYPVAAFIIGGGTTPRRFRSCRRSRCFPCYTTRLAPVATAPPWLYMSSRGTSIVQEGRSQPSRVSCRFRLPLVVPPPARYDLYPALVALLGAVGFGLACVAVALLFLVRVRTNLDTHGLRVAGLGHASAHATDLSRAHRSPVRRRTETHKHTRHEL